MKKQLTAALLVFALCHAPAQAAPQGYWHGDIRHFHDHDMERWHGGYWANRFHDGRNGWWWVVGADWYYYPAPVYPYPDPFMPPSAMYVPAASAVESYWYCRSPQGYYPYVPVCYSAWQPVPMASLAPAVPVASPAVPSDPARDRERDDRQLNAFAAEFYAIGSKNPHALERLRNLNTRVESYRQSLFERGYNAMDILRDTENLQKRIAAKERAVE